MPQFQTTHGPDGTRSITFTGDYTRNMPKEGVVKHSVSEDGDLITHDIKFTDGTTLKIVSNKEGKVLTTQGCIDILR